MDIAFVYFDLDDTLLDHQAAERAALADVRRQFQDALGHASVATVQATYHKHNAPLWEQYADGAIGKATLQRQRFVRLLEALDADHLDPETVGAYYLKRYAHHWQFMPGAEAAFQAVAAHYPVGILTNGFVETQRQKLSRFPGLRDRSEAIVISEETGHLKPDPRVFTHATDAAGVAPEEVLYVGDSRRSDVGGGTRAGWQVAWYAVRANDPDDERPVLTFEAWPALLQRLGVEGPTDAKSASEAPADRAA
jgi:HAD superfamily hydrolase (TIGR01549 family)